MEYTTHTPRVANAAALAPESLKAMMALEGSIRTGGLEHALLHLVRASQINHCAYCIYLHVTEGRAEGETDMRLFMLDAWRESTLYTPRERAALAWTEALTLVAETGAPDADYAMLKAQFSEAEQVSLTFAVGAINVWNRLQVGFRGTHPAVALPVVAMLDVAHAAG